MFLSVGGWLLLFGSLELQGNCEGAGMVKLKAMKKIWNRRIRFHSGGFGGLPLVPIGIH